MPEPRGTLREYRRKARQLEAAVVITVTVAVLAVFVSGASAHAGSAYAAKWRIINSNMVGQCGNGWAAYCYRETRDAYAVRKLDRHTWLVNGYWQERRFGGHRGRFACSARFYSGPHGIGWQPYSESCHRV